MHSGIVFAIAVAIFLTLPIALVSLVLFNPSEKPNVVTNLAKHDSVTKRRPGDEDAHVMAKKGEPNAELSKPIMAPETTAKSKISSSLRGNEKGALARISLW